MKQYRNIEFGSSSLCPCIPEATQKLVKVIILLTMALIQFGCTEFVEVDPPKNTLVSETVFDNPGTVESALANLYFDMREQGMVSGSRGLTLMMGIYSDELDYYGFNAGMTQFYRHNVLAVNNITSTWWSQAYHLIYGANDLLEGISDSDSLTEVERKRFMGQAFFIRAYIHSHLVSVYGDVPYITTTDYRQNNSVSRNTTESVYENIIEDLMRSVDALDGLEPASSERVMPDHYAAKALLARMYLYTENWEMAEALSMELIETFSLENELDDVFLKDSEETIWQLKADSEFPLNTREAEQLIIQAVPGQNYALTENLLEAFETGDQRKNHWIASISDADNTVTFHYPYKYKAGINETESLEYSIVFRLAEQYFIRAEARAKMGNLQGAQKDLNAIRNRAGLPDTNAVSMGGLLNAITKERRMELFTEQGLRWFDLKRTGMANQILGELKPNWKNTDVLLPIPENELETNPNLLPQNDGY